MKASSKNEISDTLSGNSAFLFLFFLKERQSMGENYRAIFRTVFILELR
jgi:hypothetical protein